MCYASNLGHIYTKRNCCQGFIALEFSCLRQGIYLARVLQLDEAALLWAKYQALPRCPLANGQLCLEILNRTSNSRAAQLVVTTVYGH